MLIRTLFLFHYYVAALIVTPQQNYIQFLKKLHLHSKIDLFKIKQSELKVEVNDKINIK